MSHELGHKQAWSAINSLSADDRMAGAWTKINAIHRPLSHDLDVLLETTNRPLIYEQPEHTHGSISYVPTIAPHIPTRGPLAERQAFRRAKQGLMPLETHAEP